MTDEPEQPAAEASEQDGAEYVDPCISIGDGECWIADADLLMPGEDDATGDD